MRLYDFLQVEVFRGSLKRGALVPFSKDRKNMYCFEQPCLKAYAYLAKEKLEQKAYRVAIFQRVEDGLYVFVFAKTKKDLKQLIDYQYYLNDKAKFEKQKALLIEANI